MSTPLPRTLSILAALSASVLALHPSDAARKPAPKRPAAKKPAPRKPAAKKPAAKPSTPAAAPLSTGAFSVVQPLTQSSGTLTPSGNLTVRGLNAPVKWMRNSHYQGANFPLFPPAPLPGTGALAGGIPEAPVLKPNGEMEMERAGWLTLASGSRTLTVPVGSKDAYPMVQLTPQVSGNVVTVGERLPLGVTVTNSTGAARSVTLIYNAKTASGTSYDINKFTVSAPPMSRVTTPLVTKPVTLPGAVTVIVTVQGGSESDTTGGGAVVKTEQVKTAEFPFGIVGGDLPLAAKAGVQYWAGGWPWFHAGETAPAPSTRLQTAPGFSEGFFFHSDSLGISLVSRGFNATQQDAYATAAMNQFKRRSGGWAFPYTADFPPADYAGKLETVFSQSKAIHKDTPSFLELPTAATTGVEVAQKVSEAGADPFTDVLAVRGLGVSPADETFDTVLQNVVALRDRSFPGREIWNMGETIPATLTGAVEQAGMVVRSSVEQLAGGVDKVFWSAPRLTREDGTANPAFFGLSSLTGILGGSEYVGPMPWEAPLRGEVFQKNGEGILVAWSEGGTRTATLPLGGGRAPEVFDSMQTRANIFITGNKLTVSSVPIYVTGLGRNALAEAYSAGRAKRLEAVRTTFNALEIPISEDLTTLSDEEAVSLLQKAMDTYEPESPRRSASINAVQNLLKLWDLEMLSRASANPTTNLLQTNQVLDKSNRAAADLRVEMDYREGIRNYQHDMRLLLDRVEDRLLRARVGLRQKDYALAQAHGQQMSLAARALIPYVKVLPVAKL